MIRNTGVTDSFIVLIKKLREQKKLTIEQLADLAGVHRTTIGLLERGERSPTLQVAKQIADALEIHLSELIHRAELINAGKANTTQWAKFHLKRTPSLQNIRNENRLIETIGIDNKTLLGAINSCYQIPWMNN